MRSFVALLLLVVAVSAELAPYLAAESKTAILGSYIVILKDGLTVRHRDIHVLRLKDSMATAADGISEIGFTYNVGTMMGFSAKMSDVFLKNELAHPEVKYIEADQTVSINYEQEERAPTTVIDQLNATWGLVRTSQRSPKLPGGSYRYNNDTAGLGVDVYVIDTGVLTAHVDFAGRAYSAYNAITNENAQDQNGHGTHCAGTIGGNTYGVAKYVNIYSVKVLGSGGSGTTAGVIAGVNYVTNSKSDINPSIGSMSLGGSASQALDDSIIASTAAGVVYAVAAGNNNANACNYSPARTGVAVTVAATTTIVSDGATVDDRSSFSNFGTCINIFAPGTLITSDWIGANNATINTISGTSMATPHVAGVLALILSASPQLTPAESTTELILLSSFDIVRNAGAGSVNYFLHSSPDGEK